MTRWRIILPLFILGLTAIVLSLWAVRARQNDLDRQISEAARDGDFPKVTELLGRGADPNGTHLEFISWAEPESPKPPLYHAISQGRLDVVRKLVDSGAKLKDPKLGGPLLWLSMEKRNLEMFELLLKLGANPNARSFGYEFNALHWTVEFSWKKEVPQELCVKFATLAIQHGADLNYRGMHGFTPLNYAVGWEQEQLVDVFLKAGADHRLTDDGGMNSMDKAAFRANEKLISLLKEHSAQYGIQEAAALGDQQTVERMVTEDRSLLNKRCFQGHSPLGVALLNGHTAVARYLMGQGASLEHLNDAGESLLHLAALGNCADLIESLLDKGLQVNQRDKSGDTPLHETTYSDRAEAAEILIRRGADIGAKGTSGITPTLWSSCYDSPKVLTLLLKAGADPNAPGAEDGALPLGSACHYAKTNKVPESIKVLLAAGADVNKKDASGKTPLHWAINWHGGEPLVSYLLAHGADPSIGDSTGKDALQMARAKGDTGLERLLEQFAAPESKVPPANEK